MAKRFLSILSALALMVTGGCGVFEHDSPDPPPPTGRVRVMTRNVYVGADIDLNAFEPTELLNTFLATDFSNRAEALAAEIAAVKPHFVGLQEVALFRFQIPSDQSSAARIIFADYLRSLTLALATEGLHYEPVAVVENLDIEFPVDLPPHGLVDLRLTDRDVILARSDVRARVVGAGKYEATRIVRISFEGMEMDIAVPRGYVIAEGTVQDVAIRVIGTHLETADAPAVQREQVAELIAIVDELRTERPMPEVLVGDFNSPAPPAMPVGGSYEALLEAGFVDSDPGSPGGFTCCHPPTLLGDAVMLSTRIDLVVVRNVVGTRTLAPVTTIVVGDELDDRIPVSSPAGLQLLWPSDHAGVVAELELELDR